MQTLSTWFCMGPNSILEADGFYVSYNPGNHALPIFQADDDGDETAIVKDERFYILNGDHRREYENLVEQGFEACIRYFLEHQTQVSSWSNEFDRKLLTKENPQS